MESIKRLKNNHTQEAVSLNETVQSEFKALSSDKYFKIFIEAMPDVAMVVNSKRQVIYANRELLDLLSMPEITDSIGLKPGELFKCDNLKDAAEVCGTTKACHYCGLSNSILQARDTGKPALFESRITSRAINGGQAFDIEVKTTPVTLNEHTFYIVSIKDISDNKRRLILENLFFHDILETASGLKRVILSLEDDGSPAEMRQIIENAKKTGTDLIDEILANRILLSAENHDLEIAISRCNSFQILQDVSTHLSYHEIASTRRIFIDPFSHNVPLDTDAVVLTRILINVVKNALEACDEGGTIQMGSRIGNKSVRFWVNNPGVMSVDVQNQLFQRSFSTKGKGRGTGTYSIKLLTSHYLGGEVTFDSNQEEGTTFYINIPLSPPQKVNKV